MNNYENTRNILAIFGGIGYFVTAIPSELTTTTLINVVAGSVLIAASVFLAFEVAHFLYHRVSDVVTHQTESREMGMQNEIQKTNIKNLDHVRSLNDKKTVESLNKSQVYPKSQLPASGRIPVKE